MKEKHVPCGFDLYVIPRQSLAELIWFQQLWRTDRQTGSVEAEQAETRDQRGGV